MLTTEDGDCPFEEWFNSIRDVKTSATIDARLARVEAGALGVHESVGGSVWELKIDFGPGYRIYYAEHDQTIVVLLGGGTKKRQQQDIDKAQALWEKYGHAPERLQRDLRGADEG
jgi:putative addiction module killer protein